MLWFHMFLFLSPGSVLKLGVWESEWFYIGDLLIYTFLALTHALFNTNAESVLLLLF